MAKQNICIVRDGNGDIVHTFVVDETPSAQLEVSTISRNLDRVGCSLEEFTSKGGIAELRLAAAALVKECE